MTSSALLTIISLFSPPASDSVYGTVRDAVTGVSLPGVQVDAEAPPARGTSDSSGYAITVVSSGARRLRFHRDGYQPLELSLTIPPGTSLHVDVELEPLPVPLPVLEVAGGVQQPAGALPGSLLDSTEVGLHRLSTAGLSTDPLVINDDPLLAAAAEPGAAGQSGFPTTLRIHGGSSDQNLVLLDGLPVNGVTHVGGAASLLNPDAVSSVDLHSAVPPASLGGRLSSAVEIHLRPPDSRRLQLSGAWDPTAVRQLVAGPFAGGAGSILVSARQSYRGVFSQDGDSWLENDFHDVVARGTLALRDNDIRLYLLRGGDRLQFPVATASAVQRAAGLSNQFAWSSGTAGAVWTRSRNPNSVLTTRGWLASSRSSIDWSATEGLRQVGSELQEVGMSSELSLRRGVSQRRVGISIQRSHTEYTVSGVQSLHLRAAPILIGAFVEERRALGRRAGISAGLRANSVDASGLELEPRVSIRYYLAPRISLMVGAARVHQYLQSMRNEESLLDHVFGAELPVTVGMPGVRPARSDQLSGEVSAQVSSRSFISLSGYTRRFVDLLVPPGQTAAPFASEIPPLGSGSARGLQLGARYEGKTLTLRGDLGIARSTRTVDSLEFSPGALRTRWAALGLVGRIGKHGSLRLAGTIASGTSASVLLGDLEWQSPGGWASSGEIAGSPEEMIGTLNSNRLPVYVRADLGLTRHWRTAVIGRDGLLTSTLTVTNLFNRRNVLGYYAETGVSGRQPILFQRRSVGIQLGWSF